MRMIRVFLALLGVLVSASIAVAQCTTTVTGTATDSDGQAWVNGTYTIRYLVPAGSGAITNQCTGQTISPTTVTGSLDSSGALSVTLVQTASVYGPIPGVTFTICPQFGSACYTTATVVISGTSQDVSTQISAVIKAPRVPGGPLAPAYNDTEVTGVGGNQYFRLTDNTFRCYTTSWGACGGSGSGTVNAGTTGQIAYYPGNAATVSGTSTPTSTFLDTGGAVFNVKAYGAKGDGVTNDCTAITNTVAALTSAGKGVLDLGSPGNYFVGSACHLTISVPILTRGSGKCTYQKATCPSVITSTDTSGILFNVTAPSARFDSVAIVNTAGSTPTAGAAISVSGSSAGQNVDLSGVFINGFYDNVDENGAEWVIESSFIENAVRYGILVTNSSNCDAGDQVITGNYIGAGSLTGAGSAGIAYTCGGGLKIISNKIITDGAGNFVNGILLAPTASDGQLLIIGNDIEGLSAEPIKITQGAFSWPYVTIADNYLKAPSTFSCISADKMGSSYIGGGTCDSNTYAVSITTASFLSVAPFFYSGSTGTTNIGSCSSSCVDNSELPTMGVSTTSGSNQFIGILSGASAGQGFYHNFAGVNDWVLGNNAYYNGSNWLAKSTSAVAMEIATGVLNFYGDTGLTSGNTYTPTKRFVINAAGVQLPGSSNNLIELSTDTGLSRDSAGSISIGNGTQGSFSGTIKTTNLKIVSGAIDFWSGAAYDTGLSRNGAGILCAGNGTAADCTGGFQSATLLTATNCSSAASPAVCSSAAAGSVAVAAAATTVVVDTTAVTANSQIFVQEDSSLGTKLSVTCNVTPATAPPTISARSAGTSFTITTTAPAANPRCFSYRIIN